MAVRLRFSVFFRHLTHAVNLQPKRSRAKGWVGLTFGSVERQAEADAGDLCSVEGDAFDHPSLLRRHKVRQPQLVRAAALARDAPPLTTPGVAKVVATAITMPTIPKILPERAVSGEDRPRNAIMKRTLEIR